MNQYLRRKIWTLNRSGKFRGYLRTVSGYPVTLTDCMVGQPVSLAVDGNAVQDGTPTPDNPIDVQLCGDRTGNLFDVSELTDTYGGYVENGDIYVVDYVYVPEITPEKFLEMTGLQEGDEFTTTANYKRLVAPNSNNGAEYITFMPSSSGFNSMNVFNPKGLFNSIIPVGFNSSNYRSLYIYGGSAGTDDGSPRAVWSNLAIYKGTYTAETMPAYEPHGYKVSLAMTGMNLVDYHIMFPGKTFPLASEVNYGELQLEPNTQYTLYTNVPLRYDLADIFITEGQIDKVSTKDNGVSVDSPRTVTTDKNGYLRVGRRNTIHQSFFDNGTYWIMLIEGAYTAETMPAYEPYREPQTFNIYTPQQLAKVGDTADTVVLDFDNKTATMVNAVGIDDLSAEYLRDILDNVCTFVCTFNKNKILQNSNVGTTNRFVCEYGYYEDVEKAFIAMRDYTPRYVLNIAKTRIGYTEDDTSVALIQKANDWLSENETYGLYSIANPITTDITALQDWDAMPPLWSGTAVITADTVIAPSAITAKYYASKPEEVN